MIHGHSSYTYQPVPGIIETKSSTFLNVALRTSQSRQIIIIKSRTSLFDFHCCWKLRRYSLINSAGIQYFVNWFILFINRYCYFLFIFFLYYLDIFIPLIDIYFQKYYSIKKRSIETVRISYRSIQTSSSTRSLWRWYLEIIQMLNFVHKGAAGRNEITTADRT